LANDRDRVVDIHVHFEENNPNFIHDLENSNSLKNPTLMLRICRFTISRTSTAGY
jgi:hypothetical protein